MTAFVIGFGSTEEEEREKIRAAIREALAAGRSAKSAIKPWNDAARRYDKMPRGEAPDRYTRAWCYGGKITYHHINRDHALSPDGWAMWEVEEDAPTETEVAS